MRKIYLVKGFKTDKDASPFITWRFKGEPKESDIQWCMYSSNVERCEVTPCYVEGQETYKAQKHWLNVADINTSNSVFFTFSNPYLQGDDLCNIMDTSFRYPEEKIHIIHMIKLAVRLGLKITFYSNNKEAMRFVEDYYEEYKS